MEDLSKILKERRYEKRLKKIAEERGFSLEYPSRKPEDIDKDIDECRTQRERIISDYEEVVRQRKPLEDEAQAALRQYLEKAQSRGDAFEEKSLDDYLSPEYKSLEGKMMRLSDELIRNQNRECALIKEKEEAAKHTYKTDMDRINDFLKYSLWPFAVGCLFTITGIRMLIMLIKYINGVNMLSPERLTESLAWMILFTALPVVAWIWGSCYKFYRYYNRKIRLLFMTLVNIFLTFLLVWARIAMDIFLPVLLGRKPTSVMHPDAIVNVSRGIIYIISIAPLAVAFACVLRLMERPEVKREIIYYKFSRGKDFRTNKEHRYDIGIFKEKTKNGAIRVIKEADMFLHMLIVGGTGTGKTSSVLLPLIKEIFAQIVHNTDYQKMELERMCSEGKLHIKNAFRPDQFDITDFEPAEGLDEEERKRVEDKLKRINETSPIAGMILACPESGMADEVAEMAENFNIEKTFRVDPIRNRDESKKRNWIGLNPLFISHLITGKARDDALVTNASIVMTLMSSMAEETGSVDAYFDSVNRIQTVVTCKLLLLTYESMYGVQPTLANVQALLSDYSLMRPYIFRLIKLYGDYGKPRNDVPENIETYSSSQLDAWFAAHRVNCGLWQDVYLIVTTELLDPKLGNMAKERAGGLRNQLNLFLNNPRVNELICTNDTLDIDALLANGGVVIFNYATELGESAYKALGEFFVMVYTQAILRRPLDEFKKPFYFICDELPTIINKSMAPLWTLARKYRCSTIAAMQSLSQFEQKRSIAFMRNTVISSSGQRIYFGRQPYDEAAAIEKSSGVQIDYMDQNTVSQNSLTSDVPQLNYSTRSTMQNTPYITADDAMFREFQETICAFVEDSEPQRYFIADTDFLKNSEKKSLVRPNIDWEKYYDEGTVGAKDPVFSPVIAREEAKEGPVRHKRLARVAMSRAKRPMISITSTGEIIREDETKKETQPEQKAESETPAKKAEMKTEGKNCGNDPFEAFSRQFGGV